MKEINLKKIKIIKESEVSSNLETGLYLVDQRELDDELPFDIIYVSENKINYLGYIYIPDLKILKEVIKETN